MMKYLDNLSLTCHQK